MGLVTFEIFGCFNWACTFNFAIKYDNFSSTCTLKSIHYGFSISNSLHINSISQNMPF
jgi:hypothetical protein